MNDVNRWNLPFIGLSYFFTTPRVWGWAFLGILVTVVITAFACIKVILWTFPADFSAWKIFQSIGWGFFTCAVFVATAFPFILNVCFAKALRAEMKQQSPEGIWAATLSSFWVFFRTLKWRVLWPLLILLSIFAIPFLTLFLFSLAINHLAVIESADLALSLYGVKAKRRVLWINEHGTDLLAAGLSGALLSLLVSLIPVGWLLWIPAIYCGVFLWVKEEIENKRSDER